ncbi:alpha/beta hydrolase [Actinocrispum wychmicini]|uniref:Alpha/beta hydrolase family protein n=1 Tax=Actinocrispum wychmicini TaxID=1213861 RepID=A0A4R2IQ74_9PSEU|nr:alpha/beta hydrolase [Actinocrispum wychmicini]TCO47413.1 alpha/beta hydrolase family protein [Actinocrispum wychmicini]
MRFVRTVVTTLTAGLVVAQSAVVAQAATDPFDTYSHQQLAWGPCLFRPSPQASVAECASVTVPRDWARPDSGVDLQVNISRVKATRQHTGVILTNPGGPGGQGTPLAGLLAALEPSVSQVYDFIGMDPRGTGFAGGTAPGQTPSVCNIPTGRLSTRTDLDARDRSADSIAEHQKAPRAIAEACQSVAVTPYITTWQTAHDMELIRILLGESTLNYLGYSYGTWLGAKYTSLFPASAGKIILDSSTNWQGRLDAAFEFFPVTDQRQLDDVFLPWASRQFPDLVGSTPDAAKKTWEDVRAFYKSQGVSGDDYDVVFVGNGNANSWRNAALVLTEGAKGLKGGTVTAQSPDLQAQLDAEARATYGVPLEQLTVAKIAAALQPDYIPVGLTRYAVACSDQPTKSSAFYKRLSDQQGPRYPLFGWLYGLSEACGFWSDAPQQTLPNLPPQAAGKVLVIQGEFDPQTGYEQAQAAVRAAPGVSLVSVDDSAFHGQYAIQGNPCVDGMVNVYLLRNSRPGNSLCPGVPLPGETQVFPVAGPVKQPRAQAAAAAAVPSSALREQTADFIGKVNSVR